MSSSLGKRSRSSARQPNRQSKRPPAVARRTTSSSAPEMFLGRAAYIDTFDEDEREEYINRTCSPMTEEEDEFSISSHSEYPETSLLDLPDETLDHILRYLSNTPRGEFPVWEKFEQACDAMAFALVSKRTIGIAQARMRALRTPGERFREDLLHSTVTEGAVLDVRDHDEAAHLSSMLRFSGNGLRELHISKNLKSFGWVPSFENNVLRLRKLSLREVSPDYPLDRILAATCLSLRDLEIVGTTGSALSKLQVQAIAAHCSSVRRLALRLSMFHHDWTPLWMGVGPGLEELSIGATRFWIMDSEEIPLLEQIGRYCSDIRKLSFYHLGPTLGNACMRLCKRYGSQLEELDLEQSQILRNDLQILVGACPNMRLSVSYGTSLFSHSFNMDMIELLGDQITALRYRSQLTHDESLWEAGRRCKSLKELRLDCASTMSESALGGLLESIGAKLHTLSMSFYGRSLTRSLSTKALEFLGKHTGALRDFHIGGQMFEMAAFQAMVRKNRLSLEKATVTFAYRPPAERNSLDVATLTDLISTLRRCPNLKVIQIEDRSATLSERNRHIANACVSFRHRVQKISVCGVDYIR